MKNLILILILILIYNPSSAQKKSQEIDSLLQIIKSSLSINDRFNAKAALIKRYYRDGSIQKANKTYKEALDEAITNNTEYGLGALYNVKGTIFYYQSSFDSALHYFEKSYLIRTKINDKDGLLASLGNMASMYYMKNEYKKALHYYEKAIKKEAELKFEECSKIDLNNIANIYSSLKIYSKALDYYSKAEKAYSSNSYLLMNTYQGKGDVYMELKKMDSAIYYTHKAKTQAEELGEDYSLCYILIDLGILNTQLKKYTDAKANLNEALRLAVLFQDKRIQLSAYGNLASIEILQDSASNAQKYIERIVPLQNELNIKTNRDDMAKLFAQYYYEKKEYKTALDYLHSYKRFQDSTYTIETSSQINEMQTKFETEKKEKENQLLQIENKSHKISRNYLTIILVLAIVGVIGAFFAIRNIKNSEKFVAHQKALIEIKQKEILDSINYAKRIQTALLASDNLLKTHLPEHFVLYLPKDVVSGDFYWATPTKNGFVFITGDCTGHGVPGAFMSLLNISKLSQIINEKGITQPNLILNELRSEIILDLNPEGSEVECFDGMDAILCTLNLKTKNLSMPQPITPSISLEMKN